MPSSLGTGAVGAATTLDDLARAMCASELAPLLRRVPPATQLATRDAVRTALARIATPELAQLRPLLEVPLCFSELALETCVWPRLLSEVEGLTSADCGEALAHIAVGSGVWSVDSSTL